MRPLLSPTIVPDTLDDIVRSHQIRMDDIVDGYRRYKVRLSTLEAELSLRLHASKRRCTASSGPLIQVVIGYLLLNDDAMQSFEARLTLLPSRDTAWVRDGVGAPVDKTARKLLALLDQRLYWAVSLVDWSRGAGAVEVHLKSHRRQSDHDVVAEETHQDLSAVVTCNDYHRVSWKGGARDYLFHSLHMVGSGHLSRDSIAWDCTSYQCSVATHYGNEIRNVSSVKFVEGSAESQFDAPGMVAPYGSCGYIPGVSRWPGVDDRLELIERQRPSNQAIRQSDARRAQAAQREAREAAREAPRRSERVAGRKRRIETHPPRRRSARKKEQLTPPPSKRRKRR